MTLGQRIKKARLARGLSLERLAEKMGGLTRQLVHQWENGKSDPRKHIGDLCRVLGVSPEYFFGDGPEPDPIIVKIHRLTPPQRLMIEGAIDALLAQPAGRTKARSVK